MATRSIIGIENSDGTVTSVYCHFDGYFTGVGRTLLDHYKDPEKVQSLIDLGDLSYVREEVAPAPGQSHSFGNGAKGVTMAYHRDRGEEFSQRKSRNREAFFKGDIEEYGYLFAQEGEWMVKSAYGDVKTPKLLGDVLRVVD
jgi:hypothetical protein